MLRQALMLGADYFFFLRCFKLGEQSVSLTDGACVTCEGQERHSVNGRIDLVHLNKGYWALFSGRKRQATSVWVGSQTYFNFPAVVG